ncbi:MAG TPA: PAS domain-containing sensor histidine kinase, partial [Opitutaceae bacterium]
MSPPSKSAGERRPEADASEAVSAAAEASLRLAAIVESSEDAIISKDLQGIIKTWNAAAERIFGYTAGEAIGSPILILIPNERRHEEDSILDKIRRGIRVDHFETNRRHKSGADVEVSLTISPIKDETGRIIGASKIARNIGEKKRAERALEEAHAAVVTASRAKDDFLAALSHELRTPLNPVLLIASSSAEDTSLPAAVREDFAAIRRHVEVEARLIDDLLDITRITHGKLPLKLEDVDLHVLLREAMASVRDDLVAKRITFSEALHAESTVAVGDAARLQQVLWNVLSNAVKFTPAGGRIEVTSGNDASARSVVISVSDSGIGITAEEKKRLFNAFSQGDHASRGTSHRFGGLGLGLTIARMLVELHHGAISAESAGRDKGSRFSVTLPVAGAVRRTAARERPARPAVTGKRNGKQMSVLLVEDH